MAGRYFNFLKEQESTEGDVNHYERYNLWNARDLLEYDPDTGLFIRLKTRPNAPKGSVAGHKNKLGYIEIFINSKRYSGHRLAWWWVHGVLPKSAVDHINGNPSDNRACNLRLVSPLQNSENISLTSKTSKSGFTGVEKVKEGYRSFIESKGRRMTFGLFNTAEEARASYFTAKTILHDGFTGRI